MRIAPYESADGPALARVFFDAVQIGAAGHYSQAERDAWCAARPTDDWAERRFAGLTTYVAHDAAPIGFMNMNVDGYLDMAFVAPSHQGQGIARLLHDRIEADALSRGLAQMTTYASHVAKPVFAAMGWEVIRANTVEKRATRLQNWFMVKQLMPA